MKHRSNKTARIFGFTLLVLSSVFIFACLPPVEENKEPAFGSKSADITPTPNMNLTEFESELKSMRTADFDYIFTLKRKDGAEFESDDKSFVRANIHHATNRSSFVEDDTILFIGSNYKHIDENVTSLKERFEFQDFSKPDEQIEKEMEIKRLEREKAKAEMEEANGNSNGSNENSNKK